MRFLKLQFLALVLTASALAQTSSATASGSAESILIGPGDMLHVQVFDTPEMDQHARVTDDGNVPLIFLGNVHVAGLTPEGAARTVETQLQQKEYMKHPQVTVTIEQYATQGVLVIGEVAHPGSYQIDTSRPVMDVLSMAGGLQELANRHVTIERHGTGERVQYFVSNNPEEAFNHSILVHPGDKVMVPKASLVYALGDVGRPGGYTMNNNRSQLSLLQMLALAGGTPPTARPAAARLIRRTADGYTETHIQLSDMQKGKIPDIMLEPEDILYVPFSYLKNIAVSGSSILAGASSAAVYAVP
ncbi:Capsule polysaccharide export protein [Acidisarcina polymorpha]|uniref:Capsule polysaccharide export protein n=1 Tax=Acidisarcina polymorpha TaxID=2211140 RepID=A0A2Z5FWL7_9BACT|nr:polysaccharide biosynthesis/export family protein [Acidisarcina polymorpha]AXC10907.1 Capsule polysaccharide export protein [Acidisarcina polymorpha]